MKPKDAIHCKHNAKAFSLVELVVVIGVIVLMTSLMMPALNGFTSTAGRRGSVNVLMNAFEQARAAAIENSCPIYVVMRRNANATQDYYMIVRDDRAADLPANSPQFVPLTRWEPLAKGILFYPANGTLTSAGAFGTVGFPPLTSYLPGSVPTSELFALGFNQHGQVSFPADNLSLLLAEATHTGSTAQAKGASLSITERLSFRKYTGRAQLDFSAVSQQ